MHRSEVILWITLTFCLTAGSCTDLVKTSGDEVKMQCTNPKTEVQWNLNNALLISQAPSGRRRKGSTDTVLRASITKNDLRITSLKSSDSGVYTCGEATYNLYIASAHANPSSVLYSEGTKLSCNANGGFKGKIEWRGPNNIIHHEKEVTLKSVIKMEIWTCIFSLTGNAITSLNVPVNVVGPLTATNDVTVSDGDSAELSCSLPAPSSLPITGGSWRRKTPPDVILAALMREESVVKWNSTIVNTNKVSVSDQNPNPHFNVTLKKVTLVDKGVYECSLEFGGGKMLTAELKLNVLKRHHAASGTSVQIWHHQVGGVQVWIWVAVAASSVVLMSLTIISLLILRRNKRMKRKIKRLRSMQQPLSSRNYCKCDRAARTARQPGTGKRERPPPLPRHQYSALNQ